jgi:outer membrane lipoprotein SlyB
VKRTLDLGILLSLVFFVLGPAFGEVIVKAGAPAAQEDQQTPSQPQTNQQQQGTAQEGGRHGGERGQFPGVAGTITAAQENQFTLKTIDGKTVTVRLDANTRFRKGVKDAKAADFKVGETIMVRGEATSENVWMARAVLARLNTMDERERWTQGLGKEFIAGEIKTIEGTKLTILRPDGETQVIEVDEGTSFRKQNQSVTLADFKPGDHVFGRGAIKNGVFVPAALNLGDFPRMRSGPPQESKQMPPQ